LSLRVREEVQALSWEVELSAHQHNPSTTMGGRCPEFC
jgi:hypothetical protein